MDEFICKDCGKPKSADDFYYTQSGTRRDTTCKPCRRMKVKAYRDENIEKVRQYDRDRGNQPHRVQGRYDYKRTEGGKLAHNRAGKAYNEREEVRYKAHYTVTNAVRDGKFRRECICEECLGFDKVEGHHDDYRFPLEIRWLCEDCHKDWHRKHDPIYS